MPAGKDPDADGPYFVGTIALFSQGIRKQAGHGTAGHEYKPASFAFAIDGPLREILKRNDDKLQITVVPTSVLVDGKPTRPRVQSKVRIGQVALAIQQQTKARQ